MSESQSGQPTAGEADGAGGHHTQPPVVAGEPCTKCGGELAWFDPEELRALDPDVVTQLETVFGDLTETTRAWMCPTCEEIGLVEPESGDAMADVDEVFADFETCGECGQRMGIVQLSDLETVVEELHAKAVEALGPEEVEGAFAMVCKDCGLINVYGG